MGKELKIDKDTGAGLPHPSSRRLALAGAHGPSWPLLRLGGAWEPSSGHRRATVSHTVPPPPRLLPCPAEGEHHGPVLPETAEWKQVSGALQMKDSVSLEGSGACVLSRVWTDL